MWILAPKAIEMTKDGVGVGSAAEEHSDALEDFGGNAF
jgi:hypothetical protein